MTRGLLALRQFMADLRDIELTLIDGSTASLADYEGRAVLVVNVASKCGLTPQYAALEQLARDYEDRGLSVLGVPCNQFGGQEPGSSEEIQTFCSTTYGVTFPLLEKTDVNGPNRHPLYDQLTQVEDADGHSGDISWNFEKFLITPDGTVKRFKPTTQPDSPKIVSAIEAAL
jgi:glutathione peroxidase